MAHLAQGQSGEVTQALAPTTARFVRILGVKRGTDYGDSLWEVNISPPDAR